MTSRIPAKTIRSQQIAVLSSQIENLMTEVLALTGFKNKLSINATYGGKYAEYIDIKNEVIGTPEQFISLYFQGFLRVLEDFGVFAKSGNRHCDAFCHVKKHKKV